MAQIFPQISAVSRLRTLGIIRKLALLVLFVGFLVGMPTHVRAATLAEDKVIFGGTYTLARGQILDGNLAVLGGTVILEEGSQVTGQVLVHGGSIEINGEVDAGLVISGGTLTLGEQALILGNVQWVGGSFEREDGARVDGTITSHTLPLTDADFENSFVGQLGRRILDTLWSFFLFFAFSTLAVLVVVFFPNPAARVAQTLVAQPGQSIVSGLLALIVALPVILILAITILLIPVSFAGLLIIVVAGIFGWISLGLETGHRLARAFHREWAPPVAAGVGTFLLTFVTFSLRFIFSWLCIGWMFPTMVGLIGLGAVVLSQFGSKVYQQPD